MDTYYEEGFLQKRGVWNLENKMSVAFIGSHTQIWATLMAGFAVCRLSNIYFFLTIKNSNIWPFTVTNTLAQSLKEISNALKRMHNLYVKEKF